MAKERYIKSNWDLCLCNREYTPPGTRCRICIKENYFEGIDTYYDTGTDPWCMFPLVGEEEILKVIRELDAEKMKLEAKLTRLKKQKRVIC